MKTSLDRDAERQRQGHETVVPKTSLKQQLDKELSLAIHFRNSPNRSETEKLIRFTVQHLQPTPRVIPGKCVINLLPPQRPNKGTERSVSIKTF